MNIIAQKAGSQGIDAGGEYAMAMVDGEVVSFEDTITAAQRYAEAGIPVFPCGYGKKTPKVLGGFKAATTDSEQIAEWFDGKRANIAIPTGRASGRVVIDDDSYKEGGSGLGGLIDRLGPLPDTFTVRTRAGGMQYHFAYPHGYEIGCSNGGYALHVDIKANGGYVMMPPSWVAEDAKGPAGYYTVEKGLPLAELPKAWVEHLSKPAKEAASSGQGDTDVNDELGTAPTHPPPPETPEEIRRVKAMLAATPADCGEDSWRNLCWAVMATGWKCAEDLAREWTATAADKFDDSAFAAVIASFRPDGGIGFGTLIHMARQHGYVEPAAPTTPGTPAATIAGAQFTGEGGDVKNGEIFAKVNRGKLLFIHETDEVLRFDGAQGWVLADPGEADRRAKRVLEKMADLAATALRTDPGSSRTRRLVAHVERTCKAGNIRAMIEMAQSEPGMTARLSDFDADTLLLGVANGVLNLRTGALLPVAPDVLVSKRCNVAYTPGAECPRFLKFLEEVQPAPDMRAFLQRAAGYCLTGSVREQKFLFLYGEGANGKSVFVELLAWLLGDYARKIATEMLMHHQRSPQGPSPDIVALKGCRFVYANETEEGRRLAEARVKDMTGGDTLTGRVPYGKADITFAPTHKLVMVGNHRPEITDNSFGMWRRVALILFGVTIPEEQRDANLLEILKSEGAGILNWMLEGLREWQRRGLDVPSSIVAATAAYREEQDILGDWIADHCDTGAGCTEQKAKLYKAYRTWALDNGHHPLAQGRLIRRLGERGYRLQRDKRTVSGLKLNNSGLLAAGRMGG